MRFETGTEEESDWLLAVSRLEDSAGWMDGWRWRGYLSFSSGYADSSSSKQLLAWLFLSLGTVHRQQPICSTSRSEKTASQRLVSRRRLVRTSPALEHTTKTTADDHLACTFSAGEGGSTSLQQKVAAAGVRHDKSRSQHLLPQTLTALGFGWRPICRTFVLRCLSKQHVCPRRPFIEVVIAFAAACTGRWRRRKALRDINDLESSRNDGF